MTFLRTIYRSKMNGARLWLAVAALQVLSLGVSCTYHRRSTHTQTGSKSGWRPVVGSGGLIYSFGAAQLHAPDYKIPVPVLDAYQSSSRPNPSRETLLTSVAQSYKPTTTLRTVPSPQPANQPINTYHNQYTLNNSPYKYVQNIPFDNSFIRNPHNPFAARPSYSKYPTKNKQPNNALQPLTNIQPVHFAQYQTPKPQDIFGKPLDSYGRPTENKKYLSTTMEVFKPEVFKLPDSDTASQSLSQLVKTAQQQTLIGSPGHAYNPFQQYTFQDAGLLGSFGSFGIQSTRGRDPMFPSTKTTYLPPQQTKTTIFNSFNYNPNYKSTMGHFVSTTPHYHTAANQIQFGPAFGEVKISPTPQTKVSTAPKIDPNAGAKNNFKPSFQDHFIKQYQNDYNKVTTYNPVQTTKLANNNYEYSFPSQQSQNFYDQHNVNTIHEFKKQKVVNNAAIGVNQQSKQYNNNPPQKVSTEGTLKSSIGYEVVETTEPDPTYTHSSPTAWAYTLPSYSYNAVKSTEPSLKQHDFQTVFTRPTLTPLSDISENYDTVTEAVKTFDNYDKQDKTQSQRPSDNDFEPINKNNLKDNHYKYPTSSYVEQSARRTKKPTETPRFTTTIETTTQFVKETTEIPIETLPTLAPNQYFKRPSNPDVVDKEKIRKRTKVRRRRPIQANINRNKENSTSDTLQTTETIQTADTQDVHTIRPRVKPTKPYQTYPTTPTVTTDLTTSALPTTSPTTPTIVKKKKLIHRRPTTTTERVETTTFYKGEDSNKESSIMKISNRLPYAKLTASPYEYKTAETPDYTHKQDEKDTPTSDVTVSLTDTFKTTSLSDQDFSFHKDTQPIEPTFEPEHSIIRDNFKETTPLVTDFSTDTNDDPTTTVRPETTSYIQNVQRQRLRNKYNRPRFSVKDYRNRLGSTTSTTEKSIESTPKVRFPQRRVPYNENFNSENESTTERKKFTPKDPRHKSNETDLSEEREKEIHSIKFPSRQKQTTTDSNEGSTQKISSRIRNGIRRPRPTEDTTETLNPTTVHIKRPLRKKIKDSEIGESVQDISVTETPVYGAKNDITSEKSRSESAIMKIADKKHQDHTEHLFEHSKRVSDLTLAASKDYNKPGMFKTITTNSRRIPSYFTIATDDPILPIEAFFPQLNQKKDS